MFPISILDFVLVREKHTPHDALRDSLKAAQLAEQLGFARYWVAEHHNMPNLACTATSVILSHLASGTKSIQVGAGGVMLPNHSPLVVAEQFGTLNALYPNRIDLGLGRAPGTDKVTANALRRDDSRANQFMEEVIELQCYFGEVVKEQLVQAVPASGSTIPMWVLGSGTHGAGIAAHLGLPYVHASHFAPDYLMDALTLYRQNFRPSRQLKEPYAVAAVNTIVAPTDEQAQFLFSSMQQSAVDLIRNDKKLFARPIPNMDEYWEEEEKEKVTHKFKYSFIGSDETVLKEVSEFVQMTGINELMIDTPVYSQSARMLSIEKMAKIAEKLEK